MWTYIEAQTSDGTRVFIVSGNRDEAVMELRSLISDSKKKDLIDFNGDSVQASDLIPDSLEPMSADVAPTRKEGRSEFTVHGAHVQGDRKG